jgi:hypothetical protein
MWGIQYTEGYKYRLHADAVLPVSMAFADVGFSAEWGKLESCVVTLYKGYSWDGASGPTFDDKSNMRASLVHDGLYQAMREGLIPRELKAAADQELYDYCVNDGMPKWRAWLWHRAVKKFGLSATIRNKDILCAP